MSEHKLEIVKWRGGYSVYLNGLRISGRASKPLGGGTIIATFTIDPKEVREALKG